MTASSTRPPRERPGRRRSARWPAPRRGGPTRRRRRPCRSRTSARRTGPAACAGVADVDVGRRAGAAVLVEEAEVRGERAEQREQDAELERQVHQERREVVADLAGSRVTLEVDRPVVRVTSARRVSVRLAGPRSQTCRNDRDKLPLNRGESPSEQRLSAADETGIPALLVDIDGVISLWGFPPACTPEGSWLTVDGIVHFLSAEAARNLLALTASFELVWCSGWEDKANDYLPQAIGLPGPLPFLTFEDGRVSGGSRGGERQEDRGADERQEDRGADERQEDRGADERQEDRGGGERRRPGGRGGRWTWRRGSPPLEARRHRSLGRAVAGGRVGG